MKRTVISILIIFFLALADLGLLQYVGFWGKKPDFFISTLIFFTLFYKFSLSFPLIVFAGILKDILSTSILGLYTIVFSLASILANHVSKLIMKENMWVNMLYTFSMTILILSFLNILEFIFAGNIGHPAAIFTQFILPKGIINGLISPVWFKILSRISR